LCWKLQRDQQPIYWKFNPIVQHCYRKIREVIVYHLEQESHAIFDGIVELDESYFGGIRKGKRGRGAAGKVAVFGILKCGGKVLYEGCWRYQDRNVDAAHY